MLCSPKHLFVLPKLRQIMVYRIKPKNLSSHTYTGINHIKLYAHNTVAAISLLCNHEAQCYIQMGNTGILFALQEENWTSQRRILCVILNMIYLTYMHKTRIQVLIGWWCRHCLSVILTPLWDSLLLKLFTPYTLNGEKHKLFASSFTK